ncbi:hypothetical protein Ahy_A09g046149 [Arachis hypogaea]|uniref:Mediator complex subunit 9 n=1 Tax=Arachis hypogaea TaxID=3818 RepID=A0A445BNY8_ARAHY|nr:hypothetical protein Ahy_A09g046149 [Arachis hypogaea]
MLRVRVSWKKKNSKNRVGPADRTENRQRKRSDPICKTAKSKTTELAGRIGPEPGRFTKNDLFPSLKGKKLQALSPIPPPFSNSFLQQTLASTNSCRRLLDERLLPPSIALKNFRLRALGPLARSSTSGARISPFSSVLGCSRLPPPVSARAVRVGCCSSSVVVSARFCLPVSLESRLSHWHLVVRLSRRRRQKQLVGLSLASSPSVGWTPTRRRPLLVENLAEVIEHGTPDQQSDALITELSTHFEKCQQLLNSISDSISTKAMTVEGQNKKLEESEQLLNQRRDLIANYRNSVEELVKSEP